MNELKIFISHSHEEAALANAWKDLLDSTSLGAIKIWFSSDSSAEGGIPAGAEWRSQVYNVIMKCDFVLAIQSEVSDGRPWIMWECGIARGNGQEGKIIPVVYNLNASQLGNPLKDYQSYRGDNPEKVKELCQRLIQETGLKYDKVNFTEALEVYQKSLKLHQPRKATKLEDMQRWRERFTNLSQEGRQNEITSQRQLMYSNFPKPFKPIEPTLHELLSQLLMEQKKYEPALAEVDFALSLNKTDPHLLHRKALALLDLKRRPEAQEIVDKILTINPELSLNSEIGSLQGRIYRERWEETQQPSDLDAAIEAYLRAYNADRSQYYPGVNAASLLLAKGDEAGAIEIYREVMVTCRQLQQNQRVSYWADFTMGESLLAQGKTDEAIEQYRKGLGRSPAPPPQARDSAAKGAQRMVKARKLPGDIFAAIQEILG